jgi:hypothetical protein
MRYSIYLLLFLLYSLVAVIATYIVRMMRREGRAPNGTASAPSAGGHGATPPASR